MRLICTIIIFTSMDMFMIMDINVRYGSLKVIIKGAHNLYIPTHLKLCITTFTLSAFIK